MTSKVWDKDVITRVRRQRNVTVPLKDMIFEACIDISSQPIFSRRMTSGSLECAVCGRIGFPVGPKPRICVADPGWMCVWWFDSCDTHLHAHAGGPPALDLMLVSEQTHSGTPSTVV